MDSVDSLAAKAGVSREAMLEAMRQEDDDNSGRTFDRGAHPPPTKAELKNAFPTLLGTGLSFAIPELRLARLAGPLTAGARSVAGAAGGYLGGMASGLDPKETALEQGAASLGGEIGWRGLKSFGGGMIRRALSVPGRLQDRFEDIDLPSIVMRERVPVGSQATKAGSKEMKVRMLASSKALKRRLARADEGGFKATVVDISKTAEKKLASELGRKPTKEELKDLYATMRDHANRLLADRRYGIAPSDKTTFTAREVKQIKQSAQEKASALYGKENVDRMGDRVLMKDLARGADKAMPAGTKPIERRTQELMGAMRALRNAEKRNPPPGAMTTLRGAMMRPFESPQFQSRAALATTGIPAWMLANLGPRAIPLFNDLYEEPEQP